MCVRVSLSLFFIAENANQQCKGFLKKQVTDQNHWHHVLSRSNLIVPHCKQIVDTSVLEYSVLFSINTGQNYDLWFTVSKYYLLFSINAGQNSDVRLWQYHDTLMQFLTLTTLGKREGVFYHFITYNDTRPSSLVNYGWSRLQSAIELKYSLWEITIVAKETSPLRWLNTPMHHLMDRWRIIFFRNYY